MLNRITIMGRLTREPELKYTPSNVAVCTITLACERDYAAQGQQREADFIDVVNWRQGAEFVSRYFHKGQLVAVEGRLTSRKWTDSAGNNRVSWEIVADRCYFAERAQPPAGGTSSGAYAPPSPEGKAGSVPARVPSPAAPAQAAAPRAGFDAIAREAAAVQVELEDDRGFPDLDDDDVPF